MSALAVAAARIFHARRLVSARVQPITLAPMLIVIVLFKLAISDGGRHPPTLILAQSAVYALVIALTAVGALQGTRLGGVLLLVTTAVAFTAVWSVRLDASLHELLRWLMYVGIAVATASTLRSPAGARRLVDGAVVVAGWLCLLGLFVFWGANNPGLRWSSTFYWPNPFAAFLLLVLPVELSRYVHASVARETLAHGAVSVVLAGSLLLTYSRGAWVSLLAIVPVAVLTFRGSPWIRVVWRLALAAVGAAVVAAVLTRGPGSGTPVEELLGRAASVSDSQDYSLQGRLNFWRAGFAIFLDHPVVGTGAGTFGAVHAAYQRDVRYYARDAHSLYVQTAAEEGIVGLAALAVMLSVLAATWIGALRAWRNTEAYPLVAGIGLGLVAFFLHSGVDMDWMFPANPAMAMAMSGTLAWFATDGAAGQAAARPRMGRWQRVTVIGALLLGIVLTQMAQIAEREFVSGQALARADRWPEAAERYAQAVQWDPWSPRFLAAHAVALRQLRPPRDDAAEASLRRAMVVDRMNASYPIQLASLLMDRPEAGPPQVAEAEVLLTQALTLDPWNRPETYRMLARVYLRQGRSGDADRLYRQVVPRYLGKGLGRATVLYLFLWPEVRGLVLDAADLIARRGDTAQAVQWLRGVLAEDPGAVAVALRLSRFYLEMGRVADARAVLEATAAQIPDSAVIQEALNRLR